MNPLKIPVFNHKHINPFKLSRALHIVGFAGVRNPVLRKLFDQLEKKFLEFANLPVEEKIKMPGYIYKQESAKGSDTIDLKGFIHINQLIDENDPFTKQLEPLQNIPFPFEGLLELGQAVFRQGEIFAKELLSLIGEGSGLGYSYFDTMVHNGVSSLRMLDYPPVTEETFGAIRAEAHEDINLITLLPISKQGGLQVLSSVSDEKGGKLWIDAPTGDDLFVINSGDMLDRLTNGYFPSTSHRVINPESSEEHIRRVSFPLFLHPRRYKGSDTDLTPLQHFINDEIHHDSITAREYFIERMQEIGLDNVI